MTTQAKTRRAELLRRAIRLKKAAGRSRAPKLPPRPETEEPRLGEMQRSLWLLHQLEPTSPAYNLASAFRLIGTEALDVEALERGLNRVVSRHRILRSTFSADRDGARQEIHPQASLRIEKVEADPGDAEAIAIREARRPFDLGAAPLVRLTLVEETAGERLLILVLHHILADERSLGFLWRELVEGYDGGDSETPEPAQYDDYVHWAGTQGAQSRADEIAFWRQRFETWPESLRLPFERLSAVHSAARGALLTLPLAPEVRSQIQQLASTVGITPFAVLTFAFRLLLHRITEGRDIAFATPASTRSHPATAEMIGYFLNSVVVRTSVDEELAVERSLVDFSEHLRQSLAHASVPFDVLVEELSPPRELDQHPIFQAMFVFQEAPPPPVLGDARLEAVTLDLGESKFDLTFFVSDVAASTPGERTLELAVEYRADLFDEVWMRGLLGQYETLIRRLGEAASTSRTHRPISEVSMLSRSERDQLRAYACGNAVDGTVSGQSSDQELGASASCRHDFAQSPLLPQQILDQARACDSKPAVIAAGQTMSYAELEREARRIASELMSRGVEPGDRVGLFIDRSPLLIAGLLGCHWAGAAYVPLDPAYPSTRNQAVLEDAEVAAVLSRSKLLDSLPADAAPVIDLDTLDASSVEERPLPELSAEQPAYLLYTSGSTGRPKGVVVTHGNLRASNGSRLLAYEEPPSRYLLLPSVAFDSSVAGIFWALATGGALVIPADDEVKDPHALARQIVEHQVTHLLCVPSLYGHILNHLKLLRGGASLEAAIVAGESCPPQLVTEHFQALPKARLYNEYGPTEATVWSTLEEIRRPSGAAGEASIAIGRPIPGVRLEVFDGLGRRVPVGIPGEGWIAGPTVTEGYWRRPELTAERFMQRSLDEESETRFYRTGDRLSWTVDGRLLFHGRVDEQIKLRGFRVEPGEIETALLDLPEVEQAAVVVRAGEQLVAFVETIASSDDAADRRRQALESRLPAFMVPSRIVGLPALPRLPNGKVDRGQLRRMEIDSGADSENREGQAAQVFDDRRQVLLALWRSLLGRAEISPDDNFFQLGGHSLMAVEMASAIERDFSVALTPAEIFQNPTVDQLAELIVRQGGEKSTYAHLFPLQPGGKEAPFIFAVPHFFSEMIANRFRGERPVYGLRGVSLRIEGNRGRWPTMRHLGEDLVGEIVHRFPGERCLVAGYSFGSTMAVEAVRLMEERGLEVERLYLIAPMPVDFYSLGPLRVQLDALQQSVGELSFSQALQHFWRGNHPLSRRPYQRLWRLLVIQPWRRLLCLGGQLRLRAGKPLTSRILHADVRLERFRLHAAYRPGRVRTPTVIFNANEPETDAAATWRPYFSGPLDVVPTPDPHLDAASVEAAKAVILDHLQELGGS